MQRIELSLEPDLRLVRLNEFDARARTDHYLNLRSLICQSEPMYPSIQKWFDNKVRDGLQSGERTAFLTYQAGTPAASAVVRRGTDAKLCHLRLADNLQDKGLGDLFFTLMLLEVRKHAHDVHFTLPESLWEERRHFFQSFGFRSRKEAKSQYRLFDREVRCSARFGEVWASIVQRLPKLVSSLNLEPDPPAVLLTIRATYAKAIMNGSKTVEVRRRFSNRWVGRRVAVYAASPISGLLGEAKIERSREGTPAAVWELFSGRLACSRSAFLEYTRGCEKVTALELTEVRQYDRTATLEDMSQMVGARLQPPQSYCTVSKNSRWGVAVPLALLTASSDGPATGRGSWDLFCR